MGELLREKGDGGDTSSEKTLSRTILVLPSLNVLSQKKKGGNKQPSLEDDRIFKYETVHSRSGSQTGKQDLPNR